MKPLEGINSATPFQAAERYVNFGHWPVPIPSRTKGPKLPRWQELRASSEDLPSLFPDGPKNIGLILGDDSGLADVDCDTVEAAVTAGILLPATGMVFGRNSKRASHYFFYCDPAMPLTQFKDPIDNKMLVELRCLKKDGSVGLQTVVPPSVHPSGEKIEFEPGGDGYPANIDADQLHRAVARVAATALLARHWPEKGSRHNAMLALAGALWRARWSLEAAKEFCRAVYRAVGTHDPSAMTRSDSEVEDTYQRGAEALERGEDAKVTWWPTLVGIVGEKVVKVATSWLGVDAATTIRAGCGKLGPEESGKPSLETPDSMAGDADSTTDTYPYAVKGGCIVRIKESKQGIEEIRLTNFIATITDDIAEDDGVETKRHLRIEATVAGRKSAFTVPAPKFHTMDWPIEHLGPQAIVYPNQKEYARTAIQTLSGEIPTTCVYTHTGWRRVGDRWLYLHGGGAIGKSGTADGINVQLAGALSHFGLELPAGVEELKTAIIASLHFIHAAPDHITLPLIAAAYRAGIKIADFGVWVAGPTGVFKSEMAAQAQQHYGPAMDSRHLPASFASTGNALEMVAFYAKDALLVVDDFAPHGSMQDVARYHAAAERLLRAAGNSQGRGRLTSDAKLRSTKCPRGLILVTGEDVPRGQSIRGRVLIVEVGPGDVKTAVLTENQRDAAQGLFAKAMAGFIQHLAGDYDRHLADFHSAVLETRSRATTAHSRTPGIVADLQCGFECFLGFAVEVGAITDRRRRDLADRCWIALNHVAKAQRAPQEASEPAHHFIRLLSSALAAGKAHVASMDGGPPVEDEGAWGWRLEDTGRDVKRVAKGSCIGWVEGTNLYLEPTAAYAAAQEFARSTGEPLAVSEIALNKRLKEKGLLATVDTKREVLTVRRTIQGFNRKVLHLRVGALMDFVGFSSADVGSLSGFSVAPDNSLSNGEKQLQVNVGFVGRETGEGMPGEFGKTKEGANVGMEVVEL